MTLLAVIIGSLVFLWAIIGMMAAMMEYRDMDKMNWKATLVAGPFVWFGNLLAWLGTGLIKIFRALE